MTTPTTGAAELPEALRVPLDSLHADAGYLCGRLLNGSLTQEQVVESIRRRIDAAKLAALTAQAISAEQAGVPAATVIKRGADREWMSERLGHLPDGVYSLYLAAPQPSPSPAPAQPVHVQNSPENEHVADDVSKSERESNMTAQPGQEGELLQLAKAYKEYIDALPADVVAALPAMPGVDGDWASEVLDRATRAAPQPATADAVKRRELVTNWFAENWAIEKAFGLLDDYDAAQREVKP